MHRYCGSDFQRLSFLTLLAAWVCDSGLTWSTASFTHVRTENDWSRSYLIERYGRWSCHFQPRIYLCVWSSGGPLLRRKNQWTHRSFAFFAHWFIRSRLCLPEFPRAWQGPVSVKSPFLDSVHGAQPRPLLRTGSMPFSYRSEAAQRCGSQLQPIQNQTGSDGIG